jgi:hypothetical protein
MLFLELSLTPWRFFGAAAAWPVTSQQQARRNALVGATALAHRRRERLDVEEFLASRSAAVLTGQTEATGERHTA